MYPSPMNKQTPDRQPPIADEEIREAVARADAGGPFISAEKVHQWLRDMDKDPDTPFPEPDVFKKPRG